ncbi:MAG: nucleoside-diphosphate sugar epimerase/dehydratase [bacterium]|nr:nucleoside-diphosphate sugar epimerase/dehydratase [bacterium]
MERLLNFFRVHRRVAFAVSDALLTALSIVLAFWLRFDGVIPPEYNGRLWVYITIAMALNLFFIAQGRLYGFTWGFVGLQDLARLVRALTYASAILAVIVLVDNGVTNFFTGFPRSAIFIAYFLGLIFIGSLRISKRLWNEMRHERIPAHEDANTLVIGAGSEGEKIIRTLRSEPNSHYHVVGILDETASKQNTLLHGVPVLGTLADLERFKNELGVKNVILAFSSKEGEQTKKAIRVAREAGIQNIKIIPPFSDLLEKKIAFEALKDITIEDLLGREPAKIETEAIHAFLKDKTILITGAAGSIGSEIARQVIRFQPQKLVILDFNESGIYDLEKELKMLSPEQPVTAIVGNITDRQKIERIFEDTKPAVVFHAAAYKHVPLMEEFPEEAVHVNVFGTQVLAETAQKYGVKKFVLISTDKAVRPLSVMGKTKRAAEIIVNALDISNFGTRFVAVRFGNVLASRGSVVPLFEEQIKRRAAVTITHPEMTRYFMTIPEAALLVTEAGAIGQGGEIFILDMGQPVKIVDLAHELIRLSGLRPDIDIPIVFTGIRPGEKIYEELLTADENSNATKWEKIFISGRTSEKQPEDIRRGLESLKLKLAGEKSELIKSLDEFIDETTKTELA